MRAVVVIVLLLLVVSGALLGPVMQGYNTAGRAREISVYHSMIWLEHGGCSSGVASAGLWPDYMYLPALTGISYMGDFVRPADYVLQKSTSLGFHCLAVAKDSQYFQQFENITAFHEKYQNELVTVFEIK